MNNLDNCFGLVIIGDQLCKLDQILTPNNVKPIHKRMTNYMWHMTIGLIHGE
jgi:hypothetical protein